jgi:NitT/TauT family transport system substrate-binding protein
MHVTRWGQRRTHAYGAAALVATALAVGACSSGTSSSPSSSGTSATGGTTTLHVILAPTAFEPVYIGIQQGSFAQLVNGQAQFAMSSGLAISVAISTGIGVKVALGALNNTASTQVVDPQATGGLLVAPGGKITSVADLAGKTIGLDGLKNFPELGVQTALDAAGKPASSASYVDVPLASMGTFLKNGTVAAAYAIPPYYPALQAEGYKVLATPLDYYYGNAPAVVFATQANYAASNPQVISDFTAAMKQADAYANSHPAAVRAVDTAHTSLPASAIAAESIPTFTAIINSASTSNMLKGMLKFGFIKKPVTISQLLTSSAPQN